MAKNPKKIFNSINEVEGLDLSALSSVTQGANGENVQFIREKIKESWFRLVFPMGQILTEIISLTENMAVVKATVTDGDGRIIATGLGEGFPNPDDSVEKWFLSCAETRAKGRALSAAGFGCQFDESPDDLMLTEAGIPIKPKETSIENDFAGAFDAPTVKKETKSDALQFEKNVKSLMSGMVPKMSKGVLINYGPSKGLTVEGAYKAEKSDDKLATIKQYAENSDGIFDKEHTEVTAACRVFVKAMEDSLKKS